MDQSSGNPPAQKRGQLQVYVGLLVSIGCMVWVFHSIEREEFFSRIAGANYFCLFLAFLVTFLSYFLRAWRWPIFFETKPPTFSDSFMCVIVGFFMNNVLPARMGEFVRAHLGGRATKQSRSVILATIAGERLADGLMISALFALLFSLGSTSEEAHRAKELFIVCDLFLLAGVMTGVILFARKKIFVFLERLKNVMPGHLSAYTLVRISKFISGLEPLLRPARLLIIFGLSLGVWLIELFVYYLVSLAFGVPMSIAGLILFLAAVNFSSLIPAAPGGIGVIEAFATLALVRLGVDRETALAMVACQHIIQFVVVGLPGSYLFFSRLGGRIPDSEPDLDDLPPADGQGGASAESLSGRGSASASSQFSYGDTGDIDISIIIPAFNEESRLPKTLISVCEYFSSRAESHEIIVVDDGSADDTCRVVHSFEKLFPSVKLLTYPNNRGKGYAVRFGMLNARGSLLLFTDADGATPIEEFERLRTAVLGGAQIAIGSRAMFSLDTHVRTVWYRKLLGRIFNAVVNLLLLPGIADTQCGFKLFLRPVGRYLFSIQKVEGFSFDVEVLFLAKKAGCRIVEVPVNWTNIPGSRISLVRDSLRMFLDVVRFRFRDWFGVYGEIECMTDKAAA